MTLPRTGALASDLRCLVAHGVSVVDSDLDAVTTDYGRVVRRRPRVVVRPRTSEDVAAVVRYARPRGITIGTRAAAHSQGGQALSDSILLDVRGLSGPVKVDVDGLGGRFDTGAATRWRDIVVATASRGLIPPVLTTNLSTTPGGTHSVGGIGHSSFRFGTQADNCLAFEIVTGTGDVVRCAGHTNGELFRNALCSLGRLGVVTRIEHRLRRFAPFTRIYTLAYRDLGRLFADADHLIAADRATYVHARAAAIRDRWLYVLGLTVESDHPLPPDDDEALRDLGHVHVVERTDVPYAELLRWMGADTTLSDLPAQDVVRPGIDIILPASVGAGFVGAILASVPKWMRTHVLPLVQFLRRSTLTRPMFMAPPAESLLLLSLLPSVSPEDAPAVLDLFDDISAECVRAGGKHYLAGWIPFDSHGWREHFGARWSELARLRALYDPDRVFADGVVPYATDAPPLRASEPADRAPPLFVAPGLAHHATVR